ncbi:MAG: spore coat protein CotJB [Lachnospiraceae bacterium]|nr:spore coat protein CotJB [Robinsoniella sp.]MDY3767911.1 spore coat protein CotJB [Lachnospiraceae bacterium]
MSNHELAIAFVPPQQWNTVYDLPQAFKHGTLFPDLDKPFYITENQNDASEPKLFPGSESDPCQKMLEQISQVSFAADELRLYLDTHEHDTQALDMLRTVLKQKKALLSQFATEYYPLTFASMSDCGCEIDNCYCWSKGPSPWEGACC